MFHSNVSSWTFSGSFGVCPPPLNAQTMGSRLEYCVEVMTECAVQCHASDHHAASDRNRVLPRTPQGRGRGRWWCCRGAPPRWRGSWWRWRPGRWRCPRCGWPSRRPTRSWTRRGGGRCSCCPPPSRREQVRGAHVLQHEGDDHALYGFVPSSSPSGLQCPRGGAGDEKAAARARLSRRSGLE